MKEALNNLSPWYISIVSNGRGIFTGVNVHA